MKKLMAAALLGLLLCTVGAFADHPDGWGLGIVGQYSGGWSGGDPLPGAALSLKVPSVPVYWGISMRFPSNGFLFGATGDYYIIDQTLVPDVGFGWFFGIGGYLSFASYTHKGLTKDYTRNAFALGARVPIGLSLRPVEFFEVFIDFAPSLGAVFLGGNYYDNPLWKDHDRFDFDGGWQGDIGVRFWF